MNKQRNIELLQEVLEFHENVKKAYLSTNASTILKELYDGLGAYLVLTILDFEGTEIKIYQFADWSNENRKYCMGIFINGIHQEKDIKFVKGILKKLQE